MKVSKLAVGIANISAINNIPKFHDALIKSYLTTPRVADAFVSSMRNTGFMDIGLKSFSFKYLANQLNTRK
jgi:hypothetical protein